MKKLNVTNTDVRLFCEGNRILTDNQKREYVEYINKILNIMGDITKIGLKDATGKKILFIEKIGQGHFALKYDENVLDEED